MVGPSVENRSILRQVFRIPQFQDFTAKDAKGAKENLEPTTEAQVSRATTKNQNLPPFGGPQGRLRHEDTEKARRKPRSCGTAEARRRGETKGKSQKREAVEQKSGLVWAGDKFARSTISRPLAIRSH
jgi:hypothetical protein